MAVVVAESKCSFCRRPRKAFFCKSCASKGLITLSSQAADAVTVSVVANEVVITTPSRPDETFRSKFLALISLRAQIFAISLQIEEIFKFIHSEKSRNAMLLKTQIIMKKSRVSNARSYIEKMKMKIIEARKQLETAKAKYQRRRLSLDFSVLEKMREMVKLSQQTVNETKNVFIPKIVQLEKERRKEGLAKMTQIKELYAVTDHSLMSYPVPTNDLHLVFREHQIMGWFLLQIGMHICNIVANYIGIEERDTAFINIFNDFDCPPSIADSDEYWKDLLLYFKKYALNIFVRRARLSGVGPQLDGFRVIAFGLQQAQFLELAEE